MLEGEVIWAGGGTTVEGIRVKLVLCTYYNIFSFIIFPFLGHYFYIRSVAIFGTRRSLASHLHQEIEEELTMLDIA